MALTVIVVEAESPGTLRKIADKVIPHVVPKTIPVTNEPPRVDCEELKKRKKAAKTAVRNHSCKESPMPKCPTVSDCEVFKNNAKLFEEAEQARKAYDKYCFNNGDLGHQQQIDQMVNGNSICMEKYGECKQLIS